MRTESSGSLPASASRINWLSQRYKNSPAQRINEQIKYPNYLITLCSTDKKS